MEPAAKGRSGKRRQLRLGVGVANTAVPSTEDSVVQVVLGGMKIFKKVPGPCQFDRELGIFRYPFHGLNGESSRLVITRKLRGKEIAQPTDCPPDTERRSVAVAVPIRILLEAHNSSH